MPQISPARTDSADPLAFLETPQEAGRHGLVIARPAASAGPSQIRRCTGQGKQRFGNSAAPGRSGPGWSEQDAERGDLSRSWPAAYAVFALRSGGLSAASTERAKAPSSGDVVVVVGGGFPRVPSLVCELQASTLGREYALYHSVIALSGEGERSGSA